MIGTAAAIIGSAVIGAGVSMAASSKAAKASKDATNATIAAENARDAQIRGDEQPFVQAGYGAVNALSGRLGVTPRDASGGVVGSTNALSGTPSGVVTGQPGAASYTDRAIALPEGVMMPAQKSGTVIDPASAGPPAGPNLTPTPMANGGADDFGGGARGTLSGGVGGPTASPLIGPTAGQQPGVTSNALTSTSGVGATPAGPADPGTYGNGTNPTYTAPSYQAPADFSAPAPFSYTAADYTASPGYQYQVDQALKGVQASKAAQGSLFSGDTLKALSDRAEGMALQDFNNERNFKYGAYTDQRNFDYGKYTDGRNFGRASFDTDRAFNQGAYQDSRNYLTNRFDTQTGNLFNLTNVGQAAAGATNASGTNATNGIVNALGSNATNQGNAAIAGANATTSLLGSGINALAYTSGKGGATTGSNVPGSTLGTVNYGPGFTTKNIYGY